MPERKWEVVLDQKCILGECPVWDFRQNRIFWIDILSGLIHYYYPDRKEHKSLNLGQPPGSIALKKKGGLIAAIKRGFATVDIEKETTWMITQVDTDVMDARFNDGKCDPAGRFWAGTMSESAAAATGSLYALEKNYSVKEKINNVICSNGLAWSPDHRTFYFIDTPTRQVVSYKYEVGTGRISQKKIAVSIPEEEGYPDGMTTDADGMLWIAMWDGWKVSRYNPVTGEKLTEIPLPVSRVTSCVFGGETMQDMYITTARTGLTGKELEIQPLAGSLFVVRNCGYTGMRAFEFEG